MTPDHAPGPGALFWPVAVAEKEQSATEQKSMHKIADLKLLLVTVLAISME